MARTAASVMQTAVIFVNPETPLLDVQRLFVEEEINGAPVVDETGKILGVITSADVLRAVEEERDTAVVDTAYFRGDLEFSGPDWSNVPEDFQDRLGSRTAGDAMTPGAVTVCRDEPISAVAAKLRKHRIHRVLVVEDGNLLGVISTFDLLECLEMESG